MQLHEAVLASALPGFIELPVIGRRRPVARLVNFVLRDHVLRPAPHDRHVHSRLSEASESNAASLLQVSYRGVGCEPRRNGGGWRALIAGIGPCTQILRVPVA